MFPFIKIKVLLQFVWRRGPKDSRGQGLKHPAFKGGVLTFVSAPRPVRMLSILYSSPRPFLKSRYFRGAIRSSVCFLKILSAFLTFFRFLLSLFLLYPIHLFQCSLNPRLFKSGTTPTHLKIIHLTCLN